MTLRDKVRFAKVMALGLPILVLLMCLLSCGQPVVYTQPVVQPVVQQQVQSQGDYQIMTDPSTGAQYSVFYDNGIQQMVELGLFYTWYNRPNGMYYVIHHYHDNPSYYRTYDRRRYSSWTTVPRNSPAYNPRFRSSATPSVRANTPVFRGSSSSSANPVYRAPQRPTFNSTPARSTPSPVFKSSSSSSRSASPFRSSSTRH